MEEIYDIISDAEENLIKLKQNFLLPILLLGYNICHNTKLYIEILNQKILSSIQMAIFASLT